MGQGMNTLAVVLEAPERLALTRLPLCEPASEDVVVDIEWSGISTGTERLLWSGRMPPFPGMGYPLVPGYESVGRISAIGAAVGGTHRVGDRVFVPGARCYGEVRGLFGGAASRVVVPAARVTAVDESLGVSAVLLALAATARHALAAPGARAPDLIVGHGVLGRLLARVALAEGAMAPTVWERDAARADSDGLYPVCTPDDDPRRDYRAIYDVSGDAGILDALVGRLAPGGEITLAGFYAGALSFDFPAAFMREARLRIAAEWKDVDLQAVLAHLAAGRLSLDGLVTHRLDAADAAQAYRQAFEDTHCLKMVLDWRHAA
jgi:3-hydroxyethyl bacteriochlorophyllide a dehydrogenase